MINANQLRELVIRPVLKYLDQHIPYSEDAVELLMMTAAHESKLGTYLKQVGGPALGIYQIEPRTERDIHENFLQYNHNLKDSIESLLPRWFFIKGWDVSVQEAVRVGSLNQLITCLDYATAMARVHYYRVSEKLPPKDDIKAMAVYAKRHFNTDLGKAKWEDYESAYRKLVLGEK